MNKHASRVATIIIFILLISLIYKSYTSNNQSSGNATEPLYGSVNTFLNGYDHWKQIAQKNGADRNLVIPLGYSKALSSKFTDAHGTAMFDLANGSIKVVILGLPEKESFEVWLVDNINVPKDSIKPEPWDKILKVGSLKRNGETATLETRLYREALKGFKIDLIVVAKSGNGSGEAGLLFGSPSLYQRLYYSKQRGQVAKLGFNASRTTDTVVQTGLFFPFNFLVPEPAIAGVEEPPSIGELIAEGETLFFKETFKGNGRTCGTCHSMENNLTIDPEFIAKLPKKDPLFVAEFNKDLSKNFENPKLMREFGLILENVDGFEDLEHKFVMRGVPHLFALQTSLLQPRIGADLPTNEVGQAIKEGMDMTGWSGDGAPGTGSLREFAIGAVTQHFTKTLARKAGKDFRLPNDDELDAIEAFMLSLGRQADPSLNADNNIGLKLKNPDAIAGKVVFINGSGLDQFFQPDPTKVGKCITCHLDAGATSGRREGFGDPPLFETGMNRNVATGVEYFPLPDGRDRHVALNIPVDGGFGRVNRSVDVLNGKCDDGVTTAPLPTCCIAPSPTCGIGDGRFNTPPLIEAADTPPFFHNNAFNTIEDAVAFYNSALFNAGRGVNEIHLLPEQITQIASFLRVLNALENIRSTIQLDNNALTAKNFPSAKKTLAVALAELDDATQVLDEKELHPDAVANLMNAAAFIEDAIATDDMQARNNLINEAIDEAKAAREDICEPGSDNVLCPL
jgi:cytochrome c peroxidase